MKLLFLMVCYTQLMILYELTLKVLSGVHLRTFIILMKIICCTQCGKILDAFIGLPINNKIAG